MSVWPLERCQQIFWPSYITFVSTLSIISHFKILFWLGSMNYSDFCLIQNMSLKIYLFIFKTETDNKIYMLGKPNIMKYCKISN